MFPPFAVESPLQVCAEGGFVPEVVLEGSCEDRDVNVCAVGLYEETHRSDVIACYLILLLSGFVEGEGGEESPCSEGFVVFGFEVGGGGAESGLVTVESAVLAIVVGCEHDTHGVGSNGLGECVGVGEGQVVPLEGDSQVVSGLFVVAANGNPPVGWEDGVGLVVSPHGKGLAIGLIDMSPGKDGEVHVAFAKEHVAFDLAVVAPAQFELQPIYFGGFFGDDVDHSCQGYSSIERGGRSSQHFYLLDFLKADAEIWHCSIGGVTVEAMAVEHDEYFFLT